MVILLLYFIDVNCLAYLAIGATIDREMKTNSSQPLSNKRYHISRKRRGLYHVTDTHNHVEYRTSDPTPFRPPTEVKVEPHLRDELDYNRLADVLLNIIREQDDQS